MRPALRRWLVAPPRALAWGFVFLGLWVLTCTAEGQTPIPCIAPAGWHCSLSPQVDSALRAGVDSATIERAWCLEGHVAPHVMTVYVDQALDPVATAFADRGHVRYSCTLGAATAHLHMLDHGHVDGPAAPGDLLALGHFEGTPQGPLWIRDKPFALIVVRDTLPRGAIHAVLFGVP